VAATQHDINITLSQAQVAHVVQEVSTGAGLMPVFLGLYDLQASRKSVPLPQPDSRVSRTVLQALRVLAAFPTDGTDRQITEVAQELSLPTVTAHRYAKTWVAVGLLHQDPGSRRYRRATPPKRRRAPGRRV
jgi:hypothetical protein